MRKSLGLFALAACGVAAALCDRMYPLSTTVARAASIEVEASGPAPDTRAEVRNYSVRGVVQEVKTGSRTVVIRHEAVPDFMPAMTMPFKATYENELRNVLPGDEVTFRLHVSEQDNWIDEIKKTGATVPLNRSASDVRVIRPLKVGDTVPDCVLTDQFGRAISLSQFRGRVLGLTFVFTRCPVPNFCRRMSTNFADASERLKASQTVRNWHLLSISFDPEFDTPDTLKRYGERYQYDPELWTFATAGDLDTLAGQFGLVVRRNGPDLDHNLRAAVIDAEGRVRKIFVGNEWRPDDLVREMVKASHRRKRT